MKSKTMKIYFVTFIGAISAAACSVDARPVVGNFTPTHGQTILPDETIDDWVSYSQQISIVSVVKEEEIPPPKEVLERQEGYIGRRITLRIDENLWTSPGAGPKIAGRTFEVVAQGWIMRFGKKTEAREGDSVRLLPGGRYIMPLANFEGGWAPITPSATFPAPDNQVARDDMVTRGGGHLAKGLATKSLEDVKESLRLAKPDPLAIKNAHLPAEQQIRAVRAERTHVK